ncbi:Ankyrin repeat-containing protein P16F5.05c [Grifola frondosa]|uniref:Ankyrin repeat-containing protein P16F5.05c n=1 Tax=Grifola frondosa TaxID=5627 RepID=A0A1C7M004_GRIFR|nr:Ankyrin repeat-containing protein P16F5.05c [Grifola frondosa]
MSLSIPSSEDLEELLLSCRYGDVEDIQQFIDRFGPDALNSARDDGGNSVLHMVAGNGHTEALDYLLPLVSPSLLSAQNDAKSTPLHWAALNSHLAIAQKLVRFPSGPGVDLIDIKNAAGRSSLGEAENVGWDEGAKWFVEVMNLEEGANGEEELQVPESGEGIEVEIQDADGQVAKMTIGQKNSPSLSSDGPPQT